MKIIIIIKLNYYYYYLHNSLNVIYRKNRSNINAQCGLCLTILFHSILINYILPNNKSKRKK